MNAQNPSRPHARGWRVITLVAVLVLIAIGIAIWLRQHRTQVIRAQVGDAIASADGLRVAVAIYHVRTGAWPPDNIAAGLLSPSALSGKYVEGVRIENGTIVITLGAQAHHKLRGDHVELSPYLSGSVVMWHCKSADIRANLLPKNCH